MKLKKGHRKAGLAVTLIIVTSLALILKTAALHKTVVIDPTTKFQYFSIDDRATGGSSVSSVEIVDNKFKVNCRIVDGAHALPFCMLVIGLSNGTNGVNLSSYSHFKLWIKYENPNSNHAIRFQARQIDPKYSSISDESSLKYNSLEFYEKNSYPLKVPLNQFQVPTWWLTRKQLSYEDSQIDFTNVYRLEIATGHLISPGQHNIIIERIELVGELIDSRDLYLILLAVWGSIGVLSVWNKILLMRGGLSEPRQQEIEGFGALLEEK